MQSRFCSKVLVFLALFVPALSISLGQNGNQGSISGTITDPSGAAVSGAAITVTSEATKAVRRVQSNRSGFYAVQALDPGLYAVEVTAQGFQTSITQGTVVYPGQRQQSNASLKVGNTTQQITVQGSTTQVQTESSVNSGTITGKQMSNMMLNGRNFQTLGTLIPGVSSVTTGQTMPGGGQGGETALIVNGSSQEYTAFTLDGLEDMNTGDLGNLNVLPIVDAIQEFSVLKDNYSAKYGFTGSGQVLVQTRAGTSSYHGSAWDYLRSNGTDAKNYFAITKTPFHQNIYGYTLGGPIPFTHHTFFFAANEWRSSGTGNTRTAAVFTPAQRAGDFSASPTLTPNAAGQRAFTALDAHSLQILAAAGRPGNCYLTPDTLNPSCFDPVAVYLMNTYMSLPNNQTAAFNNFINDKPVLLNQLDYNYRVDHNITDNEILTARFIYEPVSQSYPYDNYAGLPYPTTTDAYDTTGSNMFIRLNSVISPRLDNIATVAYTDTKTHIHSTSNNVSLPSGISIIQQYPGADPLNRIPTVAIGQGYAGFGVGAQPIEASDGEGILADDFSWIKGNHVIQFGAMYIFGIKRQSVFTLPQGQFSFSGLHTGDAAADFLLGLDGGYGQVSVARHGNFHYRQGEAYVQDDYKATPRLTLNLGLRYFYFSPDSVSGDQVSNFDASTFNPAVAPQLTTLGAFVLNPQGQPIDSSGQPADLTNGLVFAGQNGTPSGFFNGNKKNFAPRVGFAYALNNEGTTSIHGGFGMGYTRLAMDQIYNLFGTNPPFVQNTSVANSLLSNGTAGSFGAPGVPALYGILQHQPDSLTQTYSLTFEKQVVPNGVFTVGYAGSGTRHAETTYYDQNWPDPVSGPTLSTCLNVPSAPRYDYDPCINSGAVSANLTRPYIGYSSIGSQAFVGTSNYNSLQSGFIYRTKAVQLNLAYTYSKVLSTFGSRKAGNPSSLENSQTQNWHDLKAEYGPPDFDRRHVFATSIVYELPFFQSSGYLLRSTLGGWTFAGISVMESGFAISPSNVSPGSGLSSRPDQVSPVTKLGKLGEWFDKSSFVSPQYGFYGSARNGILRGPSGFTGDAAIYKTFAIREKVDLQFRAEAFNIANHPNWDALGYQLGAGNFGAVTSALDPRILEFALKASF